MATLHNLFKYMLGLITIKLCIFFFSSFFSDAKNMAVDVRNILIKILSTKGNMSEAEAQQHLKKMEAQKRYSADVWS